MIRFYQTIKKGGLIRIMLSTTIALLLVSFPGCASMGMGSMPTLAPGADKIVMSRNDPDKACKVLGPVSGSGASVMSQGSTAAIEAARINILNEAAAKGANYLRVETAQGSVGLEMGTAFKCP